PIDPFYLTWKAREYEVATRFIELAGEVNTAMPRFVIDRTMEALNSHKKALNGAAVLVIGLAYKKDVDDMRESPSLKLIKLLKEKGAVVSYHDPFIPKLRESRHYDLVMDSVELSAKNLQDSDVVLIATDHSDLDYELVGQKSTLIVDTRNAMDKISTDAEKVWKA
ncbi:nucleotide sugar dehydrogenase, partial [Myxococcota bacterium]|nr:nucleotide sugar dehydrogenase [Myxococcota bacterium]